MKKTALSLLTAVLFLSSASLALANVSFPTPNTTDGQPFTFSCGPYQSPFTSGGYYTPVEAGSCLYTLPAITTPHTSLEIYKGTPGNSTYIGGDITSNDLTSVNVFPISGWGGSQGDDFYAVSYGYNSNSDITATDAYLTDSADNTLPDGTVLSILQWKWGTAPAVAAPLTVTANNKSIELGSALPAFTATLSGFVSPDTANSNDVTGAASCSSTATTGSPAGNYPITCTVGTLASTNYTFTTFTAGTLTITDKTAPMVSVTSPVNDNTYLKNATVLATATATDLSPIASTVYKFDGAVVAAGSTLNLASAPLGANTLVVTATDSFGNVGYATSTFTVAPVPVTDTTAPTVVITAPLNHSLYAKTDIAYLTATVTDASAIASTVYWLNGVKINPATALPLASAPLVNKASVVAKDIYGNTATSTVTFYVVKSKNSCLLDIVTVLAAIVKDNTIPDKPTLINLIADCTALLKGLHHY